MILFHCSAHEVLKQDAVLTFVLLKSGREIDRERKAVLMLDLADIAYIPSQQPKYFESLKKNYSERLGASSRPKQNVVSLTDPNLDAILSKILPGG